MLGISLIVLMRFEIEANYENHLQTLVSMLKTSDNLEIGKRTFLQIRHNFASLEDKIKIAMYLRNLVRKLVT